MFFGDVFEKTSTSMFLTMFFKTQNIMQTMHLTMLIAHPYTQTRCQSTYTYLLKRPCSLYVHSISNWVPLVCLQCLSGYLKVRDLGQCVLPPSPNATTTAVRFVTTVTGVNAMIESRNIVTELAMISHDYQ